MSDRDVQLEELPTRTQMVLRGGRNWTAILFFGMLSLLHFSISIPSFLRGHWEGYLSFGFAIIFACVTAISYVSRYQMTINADSRTVHLRTGSRYLCFERFIPFANVHAVRLMLMSSSKPCDWRIELICDEEDIECPPTHVPRQEALYLAMALGVELIKVSPDEAEESTGRLDSL
jgi:hypothetical protein